jgi:hypothetical protein
MKKFSHKIALLLLSIFLTFSCSTPEIENIQNQNTQLKSETKLNSRSQSVNQIAPVTITYTVKQYIFQRPDGASGLGHVGVGYEVRTFSSGVQVSVTYYYGSVENSGGAMVVIPFYQNNGGWMSTCATGATMLNTMKSAAYGYKNYKYRTSFSALSSTQRANAYSKISFFPNRGYSLAGNNCMNAAWDVLWELGTPNVAWVQTNYFPNGWYNNCTVGWSASTAL